MNVDQRRLTITVRLLEIAFDRLEDDHRTLENELDIMNRSDQYTGTEPEYEAVESGIAEVYSAMNDVQIAIDSLQDQQAVYAEVTNDDLVQAISHV